jgi:hypothetical protein
VKKPESPRRGGSYILREDGARHRLTPEEEAARRTHERAVGIRKSFAQAVDETLAPEELSASAVFGRIKEALGCDSDAELAWILGTSPQSLWNRKNKNSVPYREALYVALWVRVSIDYLLTGRGSLEIDQ